MCLYWSVRGDLRNRGRAHQQAGVDRVWWTLELRGGKACQNKYCLETKGSKGFITHGSPVGEGCQRQTALTSKEARLNCGGLPLINDCVGCPLIGWVLERQTSELVPSGQDDLIVCLLLCVPLWRVNSCQLCVFVTGNTCNHVYLWLCISVAVCACDCTCDCTCGCVCLWLCSFLTVCTCDCVYPWLCLPVTVCTCTVYTCEWECVCCVYLWCVAVWRWGGGAVSQGRVVCANLFRVVQEDVTGEIWWNLKMKLKIPVTLGWGICQSQENDGSGYGGPYEIGVSKCWLRTHFPKNKSDPVICCCCFVLFSWRLLLSITWNDTGREDFFLMF